MLNSLHCAATRAALVVPTQAADCGCRLLQPLLVLLLSLALLSGCSSGPTFSSKVLVFDRSQAVPARSRPFHPPAPGEASRQQVQQLIGWLQQADAALKDKRLTTPKNNSALHYYRAVLAMQPQNEEARSGINTIVERYLQWHRQAIQSGRFDRAELYLQRATAVMPDHPALAQAARQAEQLRAQARIEVLAAAPAPSDEAPGTADADSDPAFAEQDYTALNKAALSARSAPLRRQLAHIAELARKHDSRVTITAPDDASARWLYQQLNNQNENYRIRANMRIAAQPSIRLLDY